MGSHDPEGLEAVSTTEARIVSAGAADSIEAKAAASRATGQSASLTASSNCTEASWEIPLISWVTP